VVSLLAGAVLCTLPCARLEVLNLDVICDFTVLTRRRLCVEVWFRRAQRAGGEVRSWLYPYSGWAVVYQSVVIPLAGLWYQ